SLSVTLKPDTVVAGGAQWRLLGDTTWRNSGTVQSGLPAGAYLVECKPVTGRTTPLPVSVAVEAGKTSEATATYFLPDAALPNADRPALVPFDIVTTSNSLPYAYVGQLLSDAGSSTGFVVKSRVVATAGHVVFDDGKLAPATGLQWLFQRDRGTHEPKPQVPRGYYLFDGYSAQRTSDASPGESSAQSQNLDVAALYFLEDAGRGGFGGYLASDTTDNEWLISSRMKMLVGYPVDGISAANQGRMHATAAANLNFQRVPGEFAPGKPFRTFTTTQITSSGGNSGGPLCVQYDDGKYFPAAIYLGG